MSSSREDRVRKTSPRALPIELVEKIIAMMPYPSIFKAQVLSKSWQRRFERISTLKSKEERSLAKSFHKQVAEWTHNWDTFGPVCVNRIEDPVTVFNKAARKWQRIPAMQYSSSDDVLQGRKKITATFTGDFCRLFNDVLLLEGAFFYGVRKIDGSLQEVYVGNSLTGEFMTLEPRPRYYLTDICCMKLAIYPSSETYKLVLLCQDESSHNLDNKKKYFAQIYDSKSKSWTSNEFLHSAKFRGRGFGHAYLNGILYLVEEKHCHCLLALNVEKGISEELRLSSTDKEEVEDVLLLVCNANLMMIVSDDDGSLRVLKIDLVKLQLLEVAHCPLELKLDVVSTPEMVSNCASDVNCVFFGVDFMFLGESEDHNRVLKYNKREDKWSFFICESGNYHWNEVSFEPGLNPFMEI